MSKPKLPEPEPFHPPVGTSDDGFPADRRWLVLTLAIAAVLLVALVAAARV